ncbi:uncharacterized protein TRUGW13939_08124 [Talaromyces rugulosus]|uniref:Copper transport protein n=1 Tax=Talaromyces rugulosus TaxID=121627 RepID=A0A7H8R4R4_TALRU|nr:uncharacterized protein TRUGW13939_08124 [Talaromyces rugulosus]QKX60978.1 hypothetical protein TRUGW13939_08124 [Talaromyces rugulosus]
MDMGSMTMGSATTTASAAMSSMTGMSDMDMGGGSCKISMLWNWDTIDACFISTSWQIKSRGMFAGSCIGVVLLVMLLEALRRMSKEYDRYILRRFKRQVALDAAYSRNTTTTTTSDPEDDPTNNNNKTARQNAKAVCTPPLRFRPSIVQQSIRALLHMVTFAVAYFVMLLAMYYNGYFIICIFIGAYLGGFVFSWESIAVAVEPNSMATAATEEVTVCCG